MKSKIQHLCLSKHLILAQALVQVTNCMSWRSFILHKVFESHFSCDRSETYTLLRIWTSFIKMSWYIYSGYALVNILYFSKGIIFLTVIIYPIILLLGLSDFSWFRTLLFVLYLCLFCKQVWYSGVFEIWYFLLFLSEIMGVFRPLSLPWAPPLSSDANPICMII